MTKIACVIQGNIRPGFAEILQVIKNGVDLIILSTWKEEAAKLTAGDYEVILNEKPANPGISNRNMQRVSTAAGVKFAKELGCTHVLKWRTDMLPTKLEIKDLIRWCEYRVPEDMTSRIVMSAWRNLTVDPDWFSTFPDLFAFGAVEAMQMLWSDEGMDFTAPFNMPEEMPKDCALQIINGKIIDSKGNDITAFYDAHVELYAYFRSMLQRQVGNVLNHQIIAKDFLYLIDHSRLRICWLSGRKWRPFRSIGQAYNVPWWTENIWRDGNPDIAGIGYSKVDWGRWKSFISRVKVEKEMLQQFFYYFMRKNA